MEMKKSLFYGILFLALALPAFAANLTINGTPTNAQFINTIDRTSMMNLTFNLSNTSDTYNPFVVNMTYINVTINSTNGMNIANVTAIEIINASGTVIASNTTNRSADTFLVYFGGMADGGFVINSSKANKTNFMISVNISRAGGLGNNTRVNITSNYSFGWVGDHNVTLNTNQSATNLTTITDVHASASISPRYVDTFAFNQTFIYMVNITGRDDVGNITMLVPSEFVNVTIRSITKDSSTNPTDVTSSNVSSRINISFTTAANSLIKINFTANISGALANTTVNVTLNDARLNVSADDNNTGVRTLALTIIDTIIGTKLTALANGSDYWEFNFSINFSANVSGSFLFRMDSWTNNASQTIDINTTNTSYATARLDANGTALANVTNSYNSSRYVPMIINSVTPQRIALKMIIPGGTPVSSTWWAKYFMLFITDP